MGFWHRRCALAMAAVLLVVPASAQVLVDPAEDTASAEADKPADPFDLFPVRGSRTVQWPRLRDTLWGLRPWGEPRTYGVTLSLNW